MENHVLRKMRRAGVVTLFAVGLAFTGVAPASAMLGGGFQTSDLGTNGSAVATLAVPKKGGALEYETCTGVLIKPDEILTSSDCFSYANDPYESVFGRGKTGMGGLAVDTARITFGKDPANITNAQDRVYFSVRAQTPARSHLGLSVVQLDRPVKGITPVTKASGVAQDGEKVKLVGWETTDFTPAPGAISATIDAKDKQIAYRALNNYQVSPLSWESFLQSNKAIPRIDMPDANDKTAIVPAIKIGGWRPAKDLKKELGAPVISDSGKLQGILVGYDTQGAPVIMDTGEASISDWIFRTHTFSPSAKKSEAKKLDDLVTQYTALREMLCSKPNNLKTYAKRAEEDNVRANNIIKAHNESVKNTPAYAYNNGTDYPVPLLAPYYGDNTKPLEKDPQYLSEVSGNGTELARICDSVVSEDSTPSPDSVDLVSMYKLAFKYRGEDSVEVGSPECPQDTKSNVYRCERKKLDGKIAAAEIKMNKTKQDYEKAQKEEAKALGIYKIDPLDTVNKDKYEAAKKVTAKAKVAQEEAALNYSKLSGLREKILKGLDPVVTDAVNSVKDGMANVSRKVEAAQKVWTDEDDAFRKGYEDALKAYLAEVEKKYKNELTEQENNAHCRIEPGTNKKVCDPGYPKPLESVNQSILKMNPTAEYLTKNGGKDQVKRDMKAYYQSLNESVPIMLDARYQIWNMKRMIDLLQNVDKIDSSDMLNLQQDIMDILDKQENLKKQISAENSNMIKNATDLQKLYESLPQALKDALKKKGYDKAIQDYNNAKISYQGAESDLKNLTQVRDDLPKATTGAELNSLLDKASTAYANLNDILSSLQSTAKELIDLKSYGELAKEGLVDPNGKTDPTKGMTPEEKAKYEKEQADKKRAEEAAAKKAADEAKKAKDEADKQAKLDEQRLAKALSKNTLRAEGADRVLTSIAAWKIGKFPGDSLILVDGNVHADGLSATPFAAGLKAPVLLTRWMTGLEPALMDQIKASGKKKLYLIGGQVPMTPYDEFELRDAGIDIIRIAGPDRYATSVAVNQATEPLIGAAPKKPLHLYIGDGVGFPDALVAGAAAGRVGGLMLLSKGTMLDPQTYNYISNLGQTRPLKITAVGGPAVAAVRNTPWPTTMSVEIEPVMGRDRYETAAKLSTTLPGTTAAVLATGENFADALSGGPLAVDQNAALVLTKSKELPEAAYQSLQRYGSEKTIVVGGPTAVSAKVAELVNGATLKNPKSVSIEATLAARERAKAAAAAKAIEEQRNALNTVKGMIKNGTDLQNLMAELGIGSIDQLAKLLKQPAGKSS